MRLCFLLLLAAYLPLYTRADTLAAHATLMPGKPHLRISLVTCGPGEEVWETFGHACLRVIDSAVTGAERDVIYNYGFFEASENNPISHQVVSGRVIDLLDTITYSELMAEYTYKKRLLEEQELLLTDSQKVRILAFLKNNLLRRNRYYEFDTFYDNCSTRIVDLFHQLFGDSFIPGPALPPHSRLTFRDVSITRMCPQQHKYWFGLGLNLTYASRADRVMTNATCLYLPIFLSKGFAVATIAGRPISAPKTIILEEKIAWSQELNWPFIYSLLLAIFTISGLLYRRQPLPGRIISFVILWLTGLLGCGAIYLWCLDGEPAFKDNLIILWALPTNLVLPFLGTMLRRRYAVVAMVLIGISLLLHLFRIQVLPLLEISPLLLSLIWIYALMLRPNQHTAVINKDI